MWLSNFIVASALCGVAVLAIPQQTAPYGNTTVVKATLTRTVTATVPPTTTPPVTVPATLNNSTCTPDCTNSPLQFYTASWSQLNITHITAATVVLVIDDRTNATKTVTNYVESLLVNGTAPTNTRRTDTNAAGTVAATFSHTDGSVEVVPYPTGLVDMSVEYYWDGVLPYVSEGHTTCLTAEGLNAPVPSHTPLPQPVDQVDPDDPLGLTYVLKDNGNVHFLSSEDVHSLWPGQLIDAVFQNCHYYSAAAPIVAAGAVSYLTATSTSHVTGDAVPVTTSKSSGPSPASSRPPAAAPLVGSPKPAPVASSSNNEQPVPAVSVNPPAPENRETTKAPVVSAAVPPVKPPASVQPPGSVASGSPNQPASNVAQPGSPPSPTVSNVAVPDSSPTLRTILVGQPSPSAAQQPPAVIVNPPVSSPPALSAIVNGGSSSVYVVGSQTLAPNGPAVTVSGTTFSLIPSAVVINGQTTALPLPTPAPVLAPALPPVVVGSSTISANSDSAYVVGTQTLVANGPAITVPGATLSLAPSASAVVINGETSPLPRPAATPSSALPPLVYGSSTATANSNSAYMIGTQTLVPNGPAITAAGTTLSLAPSAVVINGQTSVLTPTPIAQGTPAQASGLPPIVYGSSTITANSNSAYVISGQTLVPNGPAITAAGTTLSLAPSAVVINGQTSALTLPPSVQVTPAQGPNLPPIVYGSSTITANSNSAYIIGTQTLTPNGPAVTAAGTTFSLASTALVVNGQTSTLPQPVPAQATPAPALGLPPIVYGSSTITANANSVYIVGTQTLSASGPAITLSGTPYSLAPGGTALVVGTSTYSKASVSGLPPLTYGSMTFTANSQSAYVVGGQTLAPGGSAITLSGTAFSLAPGGTALVVGTSTIPEATGAGGYTWSGAGGNGTATGGAVRTGPTGVAGPSGTSGTSGPASTSRTSDGGRRRGYGKVSVAAAAALMGVLGGMGII